MYFIHWRQIYNINIHLRNFAGNMNSSLSRQLDFTAEYGLIFGSWSLLPNMDWYLVVGVYCWIWIFIRQLWILLPNNGLKTSQVASWIWKRRGVLFLKGICREISQHPFIKVFLLLQTVDGEICWSTTAATSLRIAFMLLTIFSVETT